ncbi:MAG: hypothetical protein G3M70_09690 [Candidatus Nitronauta litoralis]|uniref:Tetratricopeptide repeat protein n=1 Tax=Candidatus Nitronauta litoralis TaxID=2705533 RepID=A0A7T0BWD0_9BACT|nr:MAG: hypothetical protein G3M70_09690 [Candidatus Nitronauta litoralis]
MKISESWLSWLIMLLIVLAFSSVAKVYLSAQSELAVGDHFLNQSKPTRAVDHYIRAIKWHLPGLGTADEAANRIWSIAEQYEKRNFSEEALEIYRTLRGGFYSTRSFFTPGKDWISRCNEKIATLMAKAPATSPAIAKKPFEQRRAENLNRLERDRSPNVAWSIVSEAGFIGWVGCLVGLIIQGFNAKGQFRRRPAVLWSLAFVLFFAVWGFGLLGV